MIRTLICHCAVLWPVTASRAAQQTHPVLSPACRSLAPAYFMFARCFFDMQMFDYMRCSGFCWKVSMTSSTCREPHEHIARAWHAAICNPKNLHEPCGAMSRQTGKLILVTQVGLVWHWAKDPARRCKRSRLPA